MTKKTFETGQLVEVQPTVGAPWKRTSYIRQSRTGYHHVTADAHPVDVGGGLTITSTMHIVPSRRIRAVAKR